MIIQNVYNNISPVKNDNTKCIQLDASVSPVKNDNIQLDANISPVKMIQYKRGIMISE